ncbi:MAG: 5-formyltetrahydrofolate cyclo-ligase [Casimicrobiaceae bacterium]|nr:5-formyltetrahydrofolate cyclo-ligase [Casimicrobiaceae bacterium]MCX8099288.1 5-formyltetrahydrofolate cyclo-ligase [Casimicrobiaceae bacterium]MDW8313023.1 5-formyltetrahydrofolate cyclo-ligase [Burkholderiales bacterium]
MSDLDELGAERALAIATDIPLQPELELPAHALAQQKAEARARFRAVRDALPERERRAAERRILERLLEHPALMRARTVLLYASHGSEVSTDELGRELLRRGQAIAYPKMTATPGLMTLWLVRSLEALVPHRYGIRAPDITRATPIEPLALEAVIYPGLAFTRALDRLGRGGGYYDRLSARLPEECVRIGLAFEVQMAEALPVEPHDAKMHWVVTEASLYPYATAPAPDAAAAARATQVAEPAPEAARRTEPQP